MHILAVDWLGEIVKIGIFYQKKSAEKMALVSEFLLFSTFVDNYLHPKHIDIFENLWSFA